MRKLMTLLVSAVLIMVLAVGCSSNDTNNEGPQNLNDNAPVNDVTNENEGNDADLDVDVDVEEDADEDADAEEDGEEAPADDADADDADAELEETDDQNSTE